MGLTVVVGCGPAGRALTLAEEHLGREVFVLGRGEDTLGRTPELIVLAVPDDAIAEAAREIALPIAGPGTLVVHLSGALGPEVLAEVGVTGAEFAAIHPVLQFRGNAEDIERLRSATITVAGDENARHTAARVIQRWGGRVVPLPYIVDRARYHLALALASNHVTAVLAWAEELLKPAFDDDARDLTAEMAAQAVDLYRASGAQQALTGPVVRGDLATVERHFAALEPAERVRYAGLLEPVIAVAEQSGRLAPESADALRALVARHR